jgi:DnaK suppressor protein
MEPIALEQLKGALTSQLQNLQLENRWLESRLAKQDCQAPDIMDRATAESSEHLARLKYARNQQKMNSIQRALETMSHGAYGLCQLCGESIGQNRLLALPDTELCIDCQSTLDHS